MSLREPIETIRAEDFVEYFLFPSSGTNIDEDETDYLEKILRDVNEEAKKFIGDYIWQRDSFQLIVKPKATKYLNENSDEEELPSHLHGITFYGENIQDEWFIVELLFHLTKTIPGLIVRVIDSDGEFLLIEAADDLPKWANPDTCMQRVYIHNGNLLLVQSSPSDSKSTISVMSALSRVRSNPKLYIAPDTIQKSIRARFADSHNQKHRITVYLPVAAARILRENPQLIAPTIRAFCNRDQIDQKTIRAMRHFPPEARVYTDVTMTRCLYAMLLHSRFTPERCTGWKLPPPNQATFKAHTMGMKIACGFEILASKVNASASANLDVDKNWHTFLNRLNESNYFDENIENSKEHTRRLETAKQYYRMFVDGSSFVTDRAALEIAQRLKESNISMADFDENAQKYEPNDDSDDWLNISTEDLDKMLAERYGITKTYQTDGGDLGSAAADLTKDLQTFLNTKSEFDGIDLRADEIDNFSGQPSSASASNKTKTNETDVSFDPDAFQNYAKAMLDFIIPEDNWDSHSDMSDYDDETVGHGIEMMTNKSRPHGNKEKEESEDEGPSLATYMEQMDRELAATTIGKSFVAKQKNADEDDSFDDIESFTPVDIDVNALQNLAQSYQSQLGGHGPAASMLSSLGIRLNVENSPTDDNGQSEKVYNTQV